ncbi:hypothetical protein K435DRAFT_839134 [Dendrothele bispora CBS 962.96]|uniref:Uncharacterized protein n=1 Tax=Dendrothele bispora (strain CBS 962.96) TaxID=1314807 RepID=A0A4S8M2Y8_DENBC|nr:hypothetical protein K435DRAFT_839134 [Dendrothele bispora CBS 962.96]
MAVPPPFMSLQLPRNNGQRQAAPASAQTTSSSDTRSYHRLTKRMASAGSKHVYPSGGQRKHGKKVAPEMARYMHAAQWHYRAASPYTPISTLFRVAHATNDPDDPFIEDMSGNEIPWHVNAYSVLLKCVLGFKSLRNEDLDNCASVGSLNWLDSGSLNRLDNCAAKVRLHCRASYYICELLPKLATMATMAILVLREDLICNENFEGPTEKNENGAKEK